MALLESIEEMSKAERPLDENIATQGPGGQAYDLSPTPRQPKEQGTVDELEKSASSLGKKIRKLWESSGSAVRKRPALFLVGGLFVGITLALMRRRRKV